MITTFNDGILRDYGTFVVATPRNLPHLDDRPFGIPLDWHINPLSMASEEFLNLLQRLDALTFGPEGMPMDKWVFYDCAELPGFIYGFAMPASELTAHERELFGASPSYDGPVPISMYIAIPMYEEGTWFGHNLASLNRTFPDRGLHHLGSITKAIAMRAFKVERFVGATQWESKALYIHTKFGPLDLETTYTPAHSISETLTYAHTVTEECLRAAAGDPSVTMERPSPDLFLDAHDVESMIALQREIQDGARFVLCGAPAIEGASVVHPIHRAG